MIDSIQTFGDSFLFGADLKDCKDKIGDVGEHSVLTWPALIAKRLNLKYECHAESGRGNYAITFKIFQHASRNSLNIINWTWIDRFDHHFRCVGWPDTIRPNDDEVSSFYYKNIHTEFDDKFKNLLAIHSVSEYLRNNKFPFIMTYMDHLLLNVEYNTGVVIIKLQEMIKKNLKTFPNNQTFLEWSCANNYPESDNWHPLEQAHEEAAKIWLPIYEKEISKHITTNKD
jgi:hypothetical protein